MLAQFTSFFWKKILLGRQGSNLRITGSKPVALPLGYAPTSANIFAICAMLEPAHASLGGLPLICKARRADNLVLALPNLARKPCIVKLNKGPTCQP